MQDTPHPTNNQSILPPYIPANCVTFRLVQNSLKHLAGPMLKAKVDLQWGHMSGESINVTFSMTAPTAKICSLTL